MVDVDTVRIPKRLNDAIYLAIPFLSASELEPKPLLETLDIQGFSQAKLEERLTWAFEHLDKSKRLSSLQGRQQLVEETSIDRIPIFTAGSVLEGRSKKMISPYNSRNQFSRDLLTDIFPRFSLDFLSKFVFVPVQPVIWLPVATEKGIADLVEEPEGLYLEDVTVPKEAVGHTNVGIYDMKSWIKDIQIFGSENPDEALEIARHDVALAKRIAALQYARFIDKIIPNIKKEMMDFQLRSLLLYMEKTSPSAEIMHHVAKYSSFIGEGGFMKPLSFSFIGGERGILANTRDLPMKGVSEPQALARLAGFFDALQKNDSGMLRKPKEKERARRFENEKYPYIVLETDQTPNVNDVIDSLLATGKISELDLRLLEEFARAKKVGFRRLEGLVADFLEGYLPVRQGTWNQSKTIGSLKDALTGEYVFPDELGLTECQYVEEDDSKMKASDFRGSEISLPSSPKLSRGWYDALHSGDLDTGGVIENIVARIPQDVKLALLSERISQMTEEEQAEFRKNHPTPLDSIFTLRGTAAHLISAEPLSDLAEYQLLERAGISARPSDAYTETPFLLPVEQATRFGTINFTLSFHPDCYFTQRNGDVYDIFILDRKTSRYIPHMEHKYSLQTLLYGSLVGRMLEEKGKDVGTIYTALIKCAHYKGAADDPADLTHETFRPEVFSPVVAWDKDHLLRQEIMRMVAMKVHEKRETTQSARSYLERSALERKQGYYARAFPENQMLWDMLDEKMTTGEFSEIPR